MPTADNNFFGVTGEGAPGSVVVPGVDRKIAAFDAPEQGIEAAS